MPRPELFEYNDLPVRVELVDGEPWFVAADVARVLGIANIRENLRQMRDDWKGVSKADTSTGTKEVTIISEAAVYKLAFRSNKPQAEAFADWVASEVLPQIRKTGAYIPEAPAQSEGEIYLRTGRVIFSQKCKICTSPLALDINRMLDEATNYDEIVGWAASQGLSISKAGLSRHNHAHRVPQIAERSLLENPEIAARIMLAKLTEIAQRRSLDGLSDREVVKYQTALATSLSRDGGGSRALPGYTLPSPTCPE